MKADGSTVAESAVTKTATAPSSVPEPAVVKPKPYALLSADNEIRAEFDSLRDAILAATPGSTVEIQESGDHTIRRPIVLHNTPLKIAAATDVFPHIVADFDDEQNPLLETDDDLTLVGLSVTAVGDDFDEDFERIGAGALILVRDAMLKCSECRFTAREGAPIAVLKGCPSATWIDSELYAPDGVAFHWQPEADGYLVVEECVSFSRVFVSSPRFAHSANVVLSENVIACGVTFENRDDVIESTESSLGRAPRVNMAVERNLILANESLISIEGDVAVPVSELALSFRWQGDRNTLPSTFIEQTAAEHDDDDEEEEEADDDDQQLRIDGLADWVRLPSVSDAGSTTTAPLESLLTESNYDVLFDTPQAVSRIVGTLIKSRRLPVADSSVEQTLVNAGQDK